MNRSSATSEVRNFYDQIGWQVQENGIYQNSRYEDLRLVSAGYIRHCHLRVLRFLNPSGKFLLDAGCGPIQYKEYLEYSAGYRRRVCLDLSLVALREAKRRIGDHGIFVVGDVSALPFCSEAMDGFVSLHTLHHLSSQGQAKAYRELYRVLDFGKKGVIVNGWTDSSLMRRFKPLMRLMEKVIKTDSYSSPQGNQKPVNINTTTEEKKHLVKKDSLEKSESNKTGTFIQKINFDWLQSTLNSAGIRFQLYPWRSVNVRFLRALIHPRLGGHFWLKVIVFLEERFPAYFSKNGQYPIVAVEK